MRMISAIRKEALVPFEGIVHNLERRYRETGSDGIREHIEAYMSAKPCPKLQRPRLKQETLGRYDRRARISLM